MAPPQLVPSVAMKLALSNLAAAAAVNAHCKSESATGAIKDLSDMNSTQVTMQYIWDGAVRRIGSMEVSLSLTPLV